MGNPVDETIDEFLTLGRHLAELGRYSQALPSQYRGGLRLLEAHAAPRVLISPEVVPFRPHRGIYLIVEEPTDLSAQDDYLQRMHVERSVPELLAVHGVAGAWTYATSPGHPPPDVQRRPLPDDRSATSTTTRPPWERARRRCWSEPGPDAPVRPVLAAPFESMMIWNWDRFGPASG